MNVISFAIWTLEKNCFIVYSGLIVCFIAFTLYHKNKLDVYYREASKREKLARKGTGGKGDSLFLFFIFFICHLVVYFRGRGYLTELFCGWL